jgi:hypothetical protein
MFSSLLRAPLWLRPSDSDRERMLQTLGRHYAEGRISTGELEARVERTLRSNGGFQLGLQLLELPLRAIGLLLSWRVRRLQRTLVRIHFGAYASVNGAAMGIWALMGEGSFWPALVLVPSTMLLGWHLFASRRLTHALRRRGF